MTPRLWPLGLCERTAAFSWQSLNSAGEARAAVVALQQYQKMMSSYKGWKAYTKSDSGKLPVSGRSQNQLQIQWRRQHWEELDQAQSIGKAGKGELPIAVDYAWCGVSIRSSTLEFWEQMKMHTSRSQKLYVNPIKPCSSRCKNLAWCRKQRYKLFIPVAHLTPGVPKRPEDRRKIAPSLFPQCLLEFISLSLLCWRSNDCEILREFREEFSVPLHWVPNMKNNGFRGACHTGIAKSGEMFKVWFQVQDTSEKRWTFWQAKGDVVEDTNNIWKAAHLSDAPPDFVRRFGGWGKGSWSFAAVFLHRSVQRGTYAGSLPVRPDWIPRWLDTSTRIQGIASSSSAIEIAFRW